MGSKDAGLWLEYTGLLHSDTVDGFKIIFAKYLESCRRVLTSTYYHYTVKDQSSEKAANTPELTGEVIGAFYNSYTKFNKQFFTEQRVLLKEGRALANGSDRSDFISRMLIHVYNLVHAYEQFVKIKVSHPPLYAQLPGPQKLKLATYLKTIPDEKPLEALETLRRYLPRFVTRPILVGQLLDQIETDLISSLQNHHKIDVLDLISTRNQEKGALPFSAVLQLAQIALDKDSREVPNAQELEDYHEAGYRLQTRVVVSILKAERERSKLENPEIPFFTYMFPGLIKGEYKQKAEGMFFDFQLAVRRMMSETFLRLSQELENGVEGDALIFLNEIYSFFGNEFPDFFVISLVNESKRTQSMNKAEVIELIAQSTYVWSEAVVTRFNLLESQSRSSSNKVLNRHQKQ